MMRPSRNRLINAARRSMFQRAELQRKLSVAGEALRPAALIQRGKDRVGTKIDDSAHALRQEFRKNRLPLTLAAVAGLAWLFREPIRDHAPRLGRKIRDMASAVTDRLHNDQVPETEDNMENQNEAVQ